MPQFTSPRRAAGSEFVPGSSVSSPDRSAPVGILSISAVRGDHYAIRRLLDGWPCRVSTATTCATALRRLSRGRIAVVVCERDLPDGTWRDVLSCIETCADKPYLIVTSARADERLWAEVLNLGGFDLIAKPFNAVEARHVLGTACLGRRAFAMDAA